MIKKYSDKGIVTYR